MPGLILLLVVGGSSLAAGIILRWQRDFGQLMSFLSGLIMIGWIVGELILLQQFSWLQVLYLATGLVIINLSFTGLSETAS